MKDTKKIIVPKKDYLEYRDGVLHYAGINTLELVKKYGNPLKVGYPEMIKGRVAHLKECFDKAIEKHGYEGKYYYATANKASYYSENVVTAGNASDLIEISSYVDLCLIERAMKYKAIPKKKIIVNGIKDSLYIDKIIEMNQKGYHFIFSLDNLDEFEDLMQADLKYPMELAVRVMLEDLYEKVKGVIDRFGLTTEQMDYVANNYKKKEMLSFTTIHFHQRGSRYDEEKAYINLERAFKVFKKYSKKDSSVVNFDIGGGSPYNKLDEHDYEDYASKIVSFIKKMCEEHKTIQPNIIQEHGRYTVSDCCFNVYKVQRVKDCHTKMPWYIIDGSIMTSLINTWALKEKFLFLPLNVKNRKIIKVKLAGATCDSSDVYYHQEDDNCVYMPEIKNGEDLYVGVFGMGAYQEILSGIGGIHHCQTLEENDLIIYKKKGKLIFNKIRAKQELKYIYKRLNYWKPKNMREYIK